MFLAGSRRNIAVVACVGHALSRCVGALAAETYGIFATFAGGGKGRYGLSLCNTRGADGVGTTDRLANDEVIRTWVAPTMVTWNLVDRMRTAH
jgi:hypothetical protein